MKKQQVITAGVLGFLAVAIGAFGAHGLKDVLSARMHQTYETGVLYHLVHTAVLLAIAFSNKSFTKAFWFIAAGIILFSFSLYLYAITGILFLAMITPVGGVSFLIGWIMIIIEAVKYKPGE